MTGAMVGFLLGFDAGKSTGFKDGLPVGGINGASVSGDLIGGTLDAKSMG